MSQQGEPGIRGPQAVEPGGNVEVQVHGNGAAVEVSHGGAETTEFQVGPDGSVTIPVPALPPNSVVFITVGKGIRRVVLAVAVIETE